MCWLQQYRIDNNTMHQIFPKVNRVFAYHLKNFQIIDGLMDSVSLRVQAEEQYERAISKSAHKISDLASEHPLYSKIIGSFKSLINERVTQVRFFKEQIAGQALQLKEALLPIQSKMRIYLGQLKNMQRDLKSSFDTLIKNKHSSEYRLKELDEKFILNEVTVMYKQNIGLRKHSDAVLGEQKKIMKGLKKDWQAVREGISSFQGGAQEKQKQIWDLDIRVEQEFVDFFKKMNVHEISLIRNIQYDIDTMIKKTDIFNWQNTNDFKQQFSASAIEQFELSFKDPYRQFKKSIVAHEDILNETARSSPDKERLSYLQTRLIDAHSVEAMLTQVGHNYQTYKNQVGVWIQSFRKQGKFKFTPEQFKPLVQVFGSLLRYAIKNIDFECVQKIIIYGNSYFALLGEPLKKKTVLDELKREEMLNDLAFWRFYLLWSIRASAQECTATEQRQVHVRNGVYTTLLSNSLSMVDWGIEKQSIKNLVGKLAKTYGSLTESQVGELLRVIETAYQSHEKLKRNKKE